ncbi:MAG: MFS transporter [Planctomycetes bacterium]|nr:MFS transporter [Planctomycetota bacterium]
MPEPTAAPTLREPLLRAWLGLAGFYACSFTALGVYMQFFPTWLKERQGFDAQDVAVVLSAQTISRTLAGPLWSQRVDRSGDARRVLMLLAAAACGAFALFAAAPSVWSAWLVAFGFGCLYPPMHPILDAAAVRVGRERGFSFGRLRLVGSMAFLLAIVVVGPCLEPDATRRVFPILMVSLLATAVAAWFVPRPTAPPPAPVDGRPVVWWRLFGSGQFVLLLVSSALIQGSHATYYNLSTVHWNEHGIGKTCASLLWAEGVLAEVVLFFVARSTVERLRPTTLLMLGGVAAALRWTLIATTTSVPLLFAGNWLHGLSFAATYLGAIRAIERRVPRAQHATAQGLLGAATSGGGMVLCGLSGGFVYKRFGADAFFLMAAFALVGAVAALWLRRRR